MYIVQPNTSLLSAVYGTIHPMPYTYSITVLRDVAYVRLKRVIFLAARGSLWLFVFFGRMIWVGWNDIQRGEWQCRYGRWRDEFGSGGGGEPQTGFA